MKGFDLLLDAFAVADLPRGSRLVIGGDGSDLSRLREKASALGLHQAVEFRGRLSREAVRDALAEATVFVVPSRLEAFGIVVLEGWQAGVPVVATSRGGPAEMIIHGEDGLLVDPSDTTALAAAIASVVNDADFAAHLSRRGRQRVQDFTWENTTSAYMRVYESILE
jgi:glycosyltransferase involved in cell wall biosynthesis